MGTLADAAREDRPGGVLLGIRDRMVEAIEALLDDECLTIMLRNYITQVCRLQKKVFDNYPGAFAGEDPAPLILAYRDFVIKVVDNTPAEHIRTLSISGDLLVTLDDTVRALTVNRESMDKTDSQRELDDIKAQIRRITRIAA